MLCEYGGNNLIIIIKKQTGQCQFSDLLINGKIIGHKAGKGENQKPVQQSNKQIQNEQRQKSRQGPGNSKAKLKILEKH